MTCNEQTLKIDSLSFRKVLHLHKVDGSNLDGPIVRYHVYDEGFLKTRRGVYLVAQNDVIVYCGKFTTTFAKRWLYTRGLYVYHIKRSVISDAILENREIIVYAQKEEVLREQLGQTNNLWVSVASIEEKLVRDLRPLWNLIGLGKAQSSTAILG